MRALIVALALLAGMPASAMAATHYYIPPGNSSANEYVESVPTAGGGSAPQGISGPGGGGTRPPAGGAGTVSAHTRSALRHQGPDGAATAAFAAASAPTPASRRATHTPPPSGRATSTAGKPGSAPIAPASSRPAGTSPLDAVTRSVTGVGGPSGSSHWLLVILIVTALGMAAVALRRRLAR